MKLKYSAVATLYLMDSKPNLKDFKLNMFDESIKIEDRKIVDEFGFVIFKDVTVARTGKQQYMGYELGLEDPTKIIDVYREEEEVKKSVESLNGKPITINHPQDYVKTGDEVKKIGTAYNARFEDEQIKADLIFYDLYPKELKEISLGYSTSIIQKDGKYYQTDISINHIALVKSARCGSICKLGDNGINLNKDNKVNIKDENKNTGEKPMIKIKIGDKVYEVDEAVAGHIEATEKKVKELEEQTKKAYDKAIEDITSKAKVIKIAKDRGLKIDDTKPVVEIKREIVKELGYTVDGKSDDYISAILDVESKKTATQKSVTKDVKTVDWGKIADIEIG